MKNDLKRLARWVKKTLKYFSIEVFSEGVFPLVEAFDEHGDLFIE
jgi:hypothetical protein